MPFVQLVAIAGLQLILTFSLGYMALRALTRLSAQECLALAGACGIALLSAIAFVGFLTGFEGRTFFLLTTFGFVVVLALQLLRKRRACTSPDRSYLSCLILVWVSLLGTQLFIPIYSGAWWAHDWWMHYDIAQIFLGNQRLDTIYADKYTISSRTPLFNLFSAYFLGLLDNQFSTYQLSGILPVIFLLSAITLFIPHQHAWVTFVLIAFNPFINLMAIYPWPKILAALYVLSSIYFYLDFRKLQRAEFHSQSAIACGMSWGLAVLSHPSAILYVVAMIVDNVWLHRKHAVTSLRRLLIPCLLLTVVLLPWILWVTHYQGPEEFKQIATTTTGDAHLFFRLVDAGKNAINTFFPVVLLQVTWSGFTRGHVIDFNYLLRFYYSVLPGTVTVTMSVLAILGARTRFKGKSELHPVLPTSLLASMVITGFWGGCLLQPGFQPGGITGESMTPIVILIILLAVHYFYELSLRAQRLVFLLVICEFLISRGIHLLLMAMNSPFIWDTNREIKELNHLTFAVDLIGARWPGYFMTLIAFMGLVVWGFRLLPLRDPYSQPATKC